MLKKSVMIPLKHDDDGKAIEQANISHPFMRGVMEFDDYNYNQYNDMILVPDVKNASPKSRKNQPAPTDTDSFALSYKTIDKFVGEDDDYHHDLLDIPKTPAQIEEKRREKEKAEEAKQLELEQKKLKEMKKQASKKKTEDSASEEGDD